ncbi:MAG TPA: CBS domain-containing protein [Saprospiraceae bacterium]|nr:CBS domain-containing protein [Saprospiraceae bacterium]
MMNETVATIMKTEVYTVNPTNTLADVFGLMKEHKIHHVPVIENNKLVGIITTYDMLKSNHKHDELASVNANEIMTKKVATLEPSSKIGTAAEVFLEHRFHGLPVVNENHEVVGMVTTHDVLSYEFRKEYPHNPW